MDGARIISYNLNEGERPGGMKVRIKIRVESGRKGRARDARQGEALKEYLTWVVQQEQQDEAGRHSAATTQSATAQPESR